MNRKFKPGSEESINLIMESLKFAGIDCRRIKEGEEGGIFYRDKNGERKKFMQNIFVKRSLKYETERMDFSIPLEKAECDLTNDQADELIVHTVEEPQIFKEAMRALCSGKFQSDLKKDSIPGQESFQVFDNALVAA